MARLSPTLSPRPDKLITRNSLLKRISVMFSKYWFFYLLAFPGISYFLVFHYVPMLGVIIAFKDVSPFDGMAGILTSDWVGLANFERFFNSIYFQNILGNTLIISGLKLLFAFPASLVLALMLNEVRSAPFKRIVQTISYMPHFLSMVVVTGLIVNLLSTSTGPLNAIIRANGGESIAFLTRPEYFRTILVSGHVWQTIGWGTILYLAAMANIPPDWYEAAAIDGASRFQQIRYITVPSIAFVIVILLIFAIGNLLNAGFEQILLLYSPSVYRVGDIIDTYVYREGLIALQYSFASAVNLFKSALACFLLIGANMLAKRLGQAGIW